MITPPVGLNVFVIRNVASEYVSGVDVGAKEIFSLRRGYFAKLKLGLGGFGSGFACIAAEVFRGGFILGVDAEQDAATF